VTWAICYEFLRVVTHPKVLRRPSSAPQAWQFVEVLLESPGTGPFLDGLDQLGDERWQTWLEAERRSLSTKLAFALDSLAAEAEARGNWPAAIQWAERWLEVLPHDEGAAKRLFTALISAGRVADAKTRYAGFAERLRRDLDTEPNAELGKLVRRAEPSAAIGRPGLRGLVTPDLVGREVAFALLSGAWENARDGRGGSW